MVLGDVAVGHPLPGVGHVQHDVDGLAGAHEDRVAPHQIGVGDAVAREDEEPAGSVDVERVVHRVVGVHLVHQPDLHAVADAEPPLDVVVLRVVGAVDELPARVGRRRELVDVDHVVFPLDAARRLVVVAVVRMGDGARVLGVLLVLAMLMVAAMLVLAVLVTPGGPDEPGRQELHAALRAAVGRLAGHLRVHRARVAGRRRLGDELHAALRAAVGRLADDLRVHRTRVDERLAGGDVGLAHVHLRHEGQSLVRWRVDQRREPLTLGGQLGVDAQVQEHVGERTASPGLR